MKSQEASVYKQCSAAVETLMETSPKHHGGVFTEIDVVSKASKEDWAHEDYRSALHEANAVCGTQYRNRKLCRYGPVQFADGTEDYARIAGKIVYADAEVGPDYWKTPNGQFPKLMMEDDSLKRQGRRAKTERNDAEAWEKQPFTRPRKILRRRASSAKTEKDLRDIVANLAERLIEVEKRGDRLENALRQAGQAVAA